MTNPCFQANISAARVQAHLNEVIEHVEEKKFVAPCHFNTIQSFATSARSFRCKLLPFFGLESLEEEE